MSVFTTDYTIKVNLPLIEATEKFDRNFGNTESKGYSMSTIILNSDNSKIFSGTKSGNTYCVRQLENTSDFMYRFMPVNKLNFAETDGGTNINVNCKNYKFLISAVIFFILFVFFAFMAVFFIIEEALSVPIGIIITAVPFFLFILSFVTSKNQIVNAKTSLLYIFKDNIIN
ncbi:MAG: hypothetical protein ACI4IE_02840 [Eubacterium sp.]